MHVIFILSRIISVKTFFLVVEALQKLKGALGLPLRLGWNGDPCVPEQHPWSGVDCQYNRSISKHVIDGLYALDPYLGLLYANKSKHLPLFEAEMRFVNALPLK